MKKILKQFKKIIRYFYSENDDVGFNANVNIPINPSPVTPPPPVIHSGSGYGGVIGYYAGYSSGQASVSGFASSASGYGATGMGMGATHGFTSQNYYRNYSAEEMVECFMAGWQESNLLENSLEETAKEYLKKKFG